MPIFIPFVIGAAVISAVGYGGKRGMDGVLSGRLASSMVDKANAKQTRYLALHESARANLDHVMTWRHDLGSATALRTSGRMLAILQSLERRGRLKETKNFEFLGVSKEEVRGFTGSLVDMEGLFRGGVGALGAGSAASGLATGLVSSFATASTGTVISGLSGAAAQSATLAYLGGGSLAAGGYGMAAGTAVLGGIAVAPAVLVAGLVVGAKGEKALEKATKFSADVDVAAEKIAVSMRLLKRAERRVNEVIELMSQVDARAHTAMSRLDDVTAVFDDDNAQHMDLLRLAMLLCGGVRQLVDLKLLDADGVLDDSSSALIHSFRSLIHVDDSEAVGA